MVNNDSPWLSKVNEGEVFSVPISHGEGRIIAGESERISATTYKNMPGEYDMKVFESAAEFFTT